MVYMAPATRTLLWGGRGSGMFFGDTWEWDGEGWVQVADTGPAPFAYVGLAFDSNRNVTVLFTSDVANTAWDTWEWDGQGWTQVADSGPKARITLFDLVYDGARQVTLLEGGSLQSGPLPPLGTPPVGTWSWDGTSWTQLSDVGPPQRSLSALAYDASRQRVVHFGGLNTKGAAYGRETWEWDGTLWEEVENIGPMSRFGHALTGTAGATLLFGGAEVETLPAEALGDSWTWDGDHWRQRQDIGPSPRWLAGVSWDATRARGVLFGGATMLPNPTYLGDTWESFEVV
jgi:hypothetical protein